VDTVGGAHYSITQSAKPALLFLSVLLL